MSSNSSFDTLNQDTLYHLFQFIGKAYATVGLLNVRCNQMFDIHKLPKKTFIGSLSISEIEFLEDEIKFHTLSKGIANGITDFNRRDLFSWALAKKDEDLLEQICCVAATKGRIDILNELYTSISFYDKINLQYKTSISNSAARAGQLETLKWLRNKDFHWGSGTCENAALGGHFEVLRWLKSRMCRWDHKTTEAAAAGGFFDILRWVCENGCRIKDTTLNSAISAKRLDMVEWVYEEIDAPPIDAFEVAAREGTLEIIMWLHAQIPFAFFEEVFFNAVVGKNLDILQWLNDNGCDFQKGHCCIRAAYNGSVEILQWFYNIGSLTLFEDMYNKAALMGHVNVLEFLYSHNCPRGESVCHFAAKGNRLEALKWLNAHNFQLDEKTFCAAGAAGNVEMLQFLHDKNCPSDESVWDAADYKGHTKVFNWLEANGYPSPFTDDEMDY